MADLSSILLVIMVPALMLGFVGFWCLVCWLLGQISGWNQLAKRYRNTEPSDGYARYMASGSVGLVNYSNCLNLRSSSDGLSLSVFPIFRPGHPPVLILWDDLNNPTVRSFLWLRSVKLDVGSPRITSLTLSNKDFENLQKHAL